MKTSNYNFSFYRLLFGGILACILAMLPVFASAEGQSAQSVLYPADSPGQTQKIQVTSDSLISDKNTNYVEFIGNVKATQGTTVITSDRLKIFFNDQIDQPANRPSGEASIKKIVASGNVSINFDNKVAVAEEAVYLAATQVLVLTGPNSKITSDNDSISGQKITLYRADGRINVEGKDNNRVEAVFFPNSKGTN